MTTTLREIVEAGAGCGKTYGLVARYIRGLGHDPESGAPIPRVRALAAREITALTFTEDAANEMRERVVRRLSELGLKNLAESVLEESRIGTFHSLCLRLLRPHLKSLGYPAGGRIVPEAVSLEARTRHLLRTLAEDPRRAEILGHLPLRRLAELVRPLWFRVAGPEAGGGGDPLASAIESYARFRARETALAREALSARPDLAGGDSWLAAFARSLEDPTLAAPDINFNRTRKLAQELPELRASAQLWRDLLETELAPALSADAASEERAAHALIDAFFARLREGGPKLLDYAALEFELHALLARGPERRLMPPPKLLLVDEFQDTNRTQYAILRALSDEQTEWYFVGDPKQSIYKFRGADVSLFRELCRQLEHRVMDQNWRSDPPTLEFLNRLQEGLFRPDRAHDPEAQPLASGRHGRAREALIHAEDARPARAPVRVHVGPPRASFVAALARDFRARAEEFGPAATHAALFTRWKTLHAYAAELAQRGIPYAISGTQPALDHQLTHLFADALEWIDDPREASSAPLALLRWLSPRDDWSPRALSPAENAELLARFGPRPREAHWSDLLARFATLLRPARWPQGAEWTSAMSRALRELESAGQDLELSLPELARFLRRYAGGLDAPTPGAVSNPDGGPARLQLYTVHASKGLQFDCVYLPELKESRGGGPSHLHEDDSGAAFRLRLKDDKRAERPSLVFLERERRSQIELEAESRRLFYVAATRTVRSLDIYLHTPSARKTSADPLAILGWPARTVFQWNRVLCDLHDEGRLGDLEREGWLDWRELEAEAANESPSTEERWLRPEAPRDLRAPARAFFREGVSRYLERGTAPRPRPVARPRDGAAVDRAQLGTDIHAVLELWDGRGENLAPLIGDHPQRATLEAALRGVRELPELTEFWNAAARDDESVRRELGLYIHTERYRLSGFADAVWFRPDGALWILDWKTSGNLRNLARPDRAQKIRRQLALYAESLRPRFAQIHGAAIGIELGETPRVEFLFLEPLHS